ncbi:MAG: TM0996/MTH895 family glutaredoxin-like protein [Desulfovibrionaceae bacterium]|nr:TM0996/MTH895 family glutaredoxin-like protein [Desulfovibrionaceae bacterium]
MVITVMGPGCPKCKQAEDIVRRAVAESGSEARVKKLTDLQEMTGRGVFSTPAVAVDGEVGCAGRAPTRAEVLAWIGK